MSVNNFRLFLDNNVREFKNRLVGPRMGEIDDKDRGKSK